MSEMWRLRWWRSIFALKFMIKVRAGLMRELIWQSFGFLGKYLALWLWQLFCDLCTTSLISHSINILGETELITTWRKNLSKLQSTVPIAAKRHNIKKGVESLEPPERFPFYDKKIMCEVVREVFLYYQQKDYFSCITVKVISFRRTNKCKRAKIETIFQTLIFLTNTRTNRTQSRIAPRF